MRVGLWFFEPLEDGFGNPRIGKRKQQDDVETGLLCLSWVSMAKWFARAAFAGLAWTMERLAKWPGQLEKYKNAYMCICIKYSTYCTYIYTVYIDISVCVFLSQGKAIAEGESRPGGWLCTCDLPNSGTHHHRDVEVLCCFRMSNLSLNCSLSEMNMMIAVNGSVRHTTLRQNLCIYFHRSKVSLDL